LVASHIIWTADVEKALENGEETLNEYRERMKERWLELMALTKTKLP
jgi:hypothetical protein